ncbi:MAG: endonuclease/exonuclease/phosphatase family protein [Sandaracinaceae bacterium]
MATFNLEQFGPTKASRPAWLRTVAAIIRSYDLVAVQEITDSTEEAPRRLLEAVNSEPTRRRYAMSLSPRTVGRIGEGSRQEQFAYYYRPDRLQPVGDGVLYDDGPCDEFRYEPYLTRFHVPDARRSFVVINVHTQPRQALSELEAMERVFNWARSHFSTENTFIALGDFNAGCAYATEHALDALPIHGEAYDWVVPHSADTNVADESCAYDRVVVAAPEGNLLVDDWGVLSVFADAEVSDHYPVWVTLLFTEATLGRAP